MLYPTKYGIDVSVEIFRDSEMDIAEVVVHSPLYKNKTWKMNHCYSCKFSDYEILNDRDFNVRMTRAYAND